MSVEAEIDETMMILDSHYNEHHRWYLDLLRNEMRSNTLVHMQALTAAIHAMGAEALHELKLAKREIARLNKERENN